MVREIVRTVLGMSDYFTKRKLLWEFSGKFGEPIGPFYNNINDVVGPDIDVAANFPIDSHQGKRTSDAESRVAVLSFRTSESGSGSDMDDG